MAKATGKHTRTTKGWGKASPKPGRERSALMARCGVKSFLAPNKKTPGRSMFPVMSKGTRTCDFDCRGLRTAYARADQYRHPGVAKKALKLGKRYGCDWAK